MAIILLGSHDWVALEPKSKNGPDQGTKVKAMAEGLYRSVLKAGLPEESQENEEYTYIRYAPKGITNGL